MSEQSTVILDANAFITGSGLLDLGATHKFVTTPAVMDELRDVKTRDMLEKFLFPIKEVQPGKKSVQFVKEFAKKTGDLASLSDVDIQLLALAHTIYLNQGLEEKLRKAPPPLKQWQDKEESQSEDDITQKSENSQPEQITQDKQQQQTKINPTQPQQTTQTQTQNKPIQQEPKQKQPPKQTQQQDDGWIVVPKSKPKKKQQSDNDMDQDEGWITPKNYQRKMAEGLAKFDNQSQEEQVVSCGISLMTADYAMQNVAIQMGIELKSLDGRQIRQIRRFILECYLCWKTYKVEDNVVKLCKECGYNSLSKIAYSLTPQGDMILHRKKGWKPNQKVLEWKQRKFEQQQKKKKHQHARRKKEASIFDA